jgi:hypothetical protein
MSLQQQINVIKVKRNPELAQKLDSYSELMQGTDEDV